MIRKISYKFGTAFSAGEWNINGGGSRFTAGTRAPIAMAKKLPLLRKAGVTHLEFHDTELPPDQTKKFRKLLDKEGLKTGMVTANLFRRREFINGAYDSPDPKVRKMAIDISKRYLAAGINDLDAETYVYWVGTAGFDHEFAKDHVTHIKYIVDALNQLVEFGLEQFGEDQMIPILIEPKPNEPRNYMYGGTVGDALALISMMDPKLAPWVGINPEQAHSTMAGLSYSLDLSMALAAGKLGHIHLNDQSRPAFDQDYAFGDTDPLGCFAAVWTLKKNNYNGMIGIDVQPYGTDTGDQYAESVARTIRNFKRFVACCDRIDDKKLAALQAKSDQAGVADLVAKALTGARM